MTEKINSPTDPSKKLPTTPLKLRNPTEYHLLATQGQGYPNSAQGNFLLNHHQDPLEDQNMILGGCFSQQFQSPSMSSPPLQDFDDMDSLSGGHALSSVYINPALTQSHSVPDQSLYFASPLSNNNMKIEEFAESPSDCSDFIPNYSPVSYPSNSFIMELNRNNAAGRKGETTQSINSRMGYSLDHYPSLSAPAHVGYGFNPGHMNTAAAMFQHMDPSYGISAVGAQNFEEYNSMQLTQQEIAEKKRRRRESHNAVERRRRENINDRIQELGGMLPAAMIEELTNPNVTNGNNKPNKGAILRKSVEYILSMQQEVIDCKQREKELEEELKRTQALYALKASK